MTTDKKIVRKRRTVKKDVTKPTKKKATKTKAKVTTAVETQGPVTLPLDELYVYKLQLLNKNLEEAKAAIAGPLREAYQAELVSKINEALRLDPKTKEAFNARVRCVNDLLDKVTGDFPEGYKITVISPEDAQITAEFNPEQVDQRLEEQT